MRRTTGVMLAVWVVAAVCEPVGAIAQTIAAPPPLPPLNLPPDRDPKPGPYLVFFDDTGLLPEGDIMLKQAVEHWQDGGNEAFLLCSRRRNGAAPGPSQQVSQVAARLRAHGAKLVVSANPEACAGPLLYGAQRDYDSVEIRGTYAK